MASSTNLSSIASSSEYESLPSMHLSEIKPKLSNIIQENVSDLVQACRNFDQRSANKIHKTQLRQVLRKFCFPLTAAQFNSILYEVGNQQNGKINYLNFFSKFLEGQKIAYDKKCERIEDLDLPIEEIELQIKEKIKPQLHDVVHSFQLFDINNDGFIQKCELRRIIKNYCFDLNESLFNELWKIYVPKSTEVINYKDFLVKLGINAERYKQYFPNNNVSEDLHRYQMKFKDDTINNEQRIRQSAMQGKCDSSIEGLPIEEVMVIFLDRVLKNAKLLKNTFDLFDYEKNGEITLSDFCVVINFCVMTLSPKLFDQVFKRLGIDNSFDCKVQYKDFLHKYANVDSKNIFEKETVKLECIPAIQKIKNRGTCTNTCFHSMFTKVNEKDECQITRNELKSILDTDLQLRLSEEEFKDLTNLLDPENTNIINWKIFLNLFDNSVEKVHEKQCSVSLNNPVQEEKYLSLKGEKLQSKLKYCLNKTMKEVEKVMTLVDQSQSGFISLYKLKNILEGFCFPLTNEQFEEIIYNFEKCRDTLNYRKFLNYFRKQPSEEVDEWIVAVTKLTDFKSRFSELPMDEIEEMLHECIQSRKTKMLKDFKTLDICNVGLICKDDARSVLNKFCYRFNDHQFEELWKTFPRNKFEQLLYHKFLEKYSVPVKKKNSHHVKDTNSTFESSEKQAMPKAASVTGIKSNQKPPESRKHTKEILYSEAPHLQKIFECMESAVVRNFRTIRYHLHRADSKLTGLVHFSVLLNILAKSAIQISPEDQFNILEYFDRSLSGKINYRDFLRIFVWYA